MQFCVMLDVPIPYGHVFRVTNDKLGTTVKEIIDLFVAKVKEADYPDFDLSKHTLYVHDQTDPFNPMQPYELKDWNMKISDIGHDSFDLFLTMQPHLAVPPCEGITKGQSVVNEVEELTVEAWRKVQQKDFRNAFVLLEQAKKLDPSDPRPHRILAKAAIRMGKMCDNMSLIANSVQLFPKDKDLKLLWGIAEYKRGNYKNSLAILRELRTYGKCEPKDIDDIDLYTAKCYFAMRHFKEAEKIVHNLVDIVPTKTEAARLMARILLLRGDIVGSVKLMISRSKYSSDFRFLWRYIGNDIASPEALKIFTSECYDWMKKANFPFFMAQALFELGNDVFAEPYFLRAMLLKPDSPSVTLGFVRYLVAIKNDIDEIVSVVNKFLKAAKTEAAFILGPRSDSIHHIIGNELVQDYSENAERFEPVPFKLHSFEQGPLYGNEELDTIGVLMQLQIALFRGGYVSQSYKISSAIIDKIRPYSLNQSVIHHEAELCMLIHSFCPTIPRPLPQVRKFIYAIGGRAVIPLAYKVLTIKGEQVMVYPIVIPGFKFMSLEKPSARRSSFWINLSRIPKGSRLLLCCGDQDYEDIVVTLRGLLKYDLAPRVVDYPFKVLASRLSMLSSFRVFIHPILPVVMKQNFADHLAFYARMQAILNPEIQNTAKHVTILDFHTNMIDENSQVKPEFLTDSVWNERYIAELEGNLNRAVENDPPPPEQSFMLL